MAKRVDNIINKSKVFPFGVRMIAARERAGLTQLDVYPLFGHQNSSRLSKIESGEHAMAVSYDVLAVATRIYGVSSDYLLGFTDIPNAAPDEIIQAKAQKILPKLMAGEEEKIRSIVTALDKIAAHVERNEARTKELLTAINRFRELNPGFDDMPGGAKLERIIAEVRYDAKRGSEELTHLRKSLKKNSI